jgi:hypothetical protein
MVSPEPLTDTVMPATPSCLKVAKRYTTMKAKSLSFFPLRISMPDLTNPRALFILRQHA